MPADREQPGKRTLTEAIDVPGVAMPGAAAPIQRAVAGSGGSGVAMQHALRSDPERPLLAELFGRSAAPIQGKGIAPAPGPASLAREPAGGTGDAVPEAARGQMERAFGADFSAVRVHEDGSAEAMGARAYTRGNDIHFAPGQYDPGSQAGQELLGHELAHVVQQSQGRVSAPTQAKGVPINADPGLEREADELGARAARGEVVAKGGGGPAPRDSAVQAKINYDKTWAALGGYGSWHAGKEALWTQVSKAYNTTFLTLIGWLDADGNAGGRYRRTLLDATMPPSDALRAALVTVDAFRTYDGSNISVTIGEDIRDRLIPVLNSNVRGRLETWYSGQLQHWRGCVAELKQKLTSKTDPATVHGGLDLLGDRQAFEPHKKARAELLVALDDLATRTRPDDIDTELSAKTREGSCTYEDWIEVVITAYTTAKEDIERARSRNRRDKEARVAREQRLEEGRLEQQRLEQEAFQKDSDKIARWAGNSGRQLSSLYSRAELLQLAGALNSKDAGRVAAISSLVPDLDSNKPKLIELLLEYQGDLQSLASAMSTHGAVAFSLLSAGVTLDDTNTVLAEDGARAFIELYGKAAVVLIKRKAHATALEAFAALCGKSYLERDWLTNHLKQLVMLRKKIDNTPGVNHFLNTYGKAGLDMIVSTPEITNHGTVDLSALREALQAGAGISYYPYDPRDTSNLGGTGGATRTKFAKDSSDELTAFGQTHDRTDKTLTRAEKLRFMGKKDSDMDSFSSKDWDDYKQLKTWDNLKSEQRGELKSEDDRSLRELKVKATMQLVKKTGEVVDRDLQVFVSGGEHSSGYDYTGSDDTVKQTGQKHGSAPLTGKTYDVSGQSREDYQHVGHCHIGHHDGSREHDAEVKIVSQTVAALAALAGELDGGTLRIFVDRYTCPNCSDLLYKAKTDSQLLKKLAAIEVIYTGGRT